MISLLYFRSKPGKSESHFHNIHCSFGYPNDLHIFEIEQSTLKFFYSLGLMQILYKTSILDLVG